MILSTVKVLSSCLLSVADGALQRWVELPKQCDCYLLILLEAHVTGLTTFPPEQLPMSCFFLVLTLK